jgi:flagellar hook-associated protein 2
MAITASGIGSGLDISGLVQQLVAAEAEPKNARLNSQEINLGSELSAFGTLKSALSAFQSSVTKLESETAFQVFTANSSKEDVFTATANNTAVSGNYSIEVVQLAQAEKLRSVDFTSSGDVVGTGTLDISLGATSFQLTIDSSNNTLTGIRDAINAALDNPGVSASLITVDSGTQLILSADKVGVSNTINIAATDNDALDGFDLTRLDSASLISLQSASDAVIKVDSQTVTRDSNSFSDVISGVTFNLAKAQSGSVETLSVVLDTQAIKKDIESFVSNYSTLVGVMKGLSNFDVSTRVAGPLNGDSVIRGIQNSLRQTLSASVTGGAFSHLSELGITLDDKGSLNIDDTVLDTKLASNLSDVKQFFSSSTGKAQSFTTALSGYVADDGIIDTRSDGLQNRLDGIDDKREVLDRRMQALEARLNAQFTAMDILVAQLQSTGNFLTQQLANLPQPMSTSR